ncbi:MULTISPECIES: hypothetical protein, partial [Sphingomonadales]|uniref:hypothetical protein n=1 Tax=Sphingomonadales TaxID=204457 RepID=UPI001E2A31EB
MPDLPRAAKAAAKLCVAKRFETRSLTNFLHSWQMSLHSAFVPVRALLQTLVTAGQRHPVWGS